MDGFLNPAAQLGVFIPIFIPCPSSKKHRDRMSLVGLPQFILTMPEREAWSDGESVERQKRLKMGEGACKAL